MPRAELVWETAVGVKMLLFLTKINFCKEKVDKALQIFLTIGLQQSLQISHLTIKNHSALNWEMCSKCIRGNISNLLGSEKHHEKSLNKADVFHLTVNPRIVVRPFNGT